MAVKLLLGPVLGLEANERYTVLFVTSQTDTAQVTYGSNLAKAIPIGEIYSGTVWRAELVIEPAVNAQNISYHITLDGLQAASKSAVSVWQFYVPAMDEKPKLAYASCNGFSDLKLLTTTDNPYHLWQKMADEHRFNPFSILIMGGDQIYADAIWSVVPSLKAWNDLGRDTKINRTATKTMQAQIDRFYSELYLERWNKPEVAHMLASIPSVMMWDDHDIFDGWGSYPMDIQQCPVYQAIFNGAKAYFELLQLRGLHNTSLLSQGQAAPKHYSFGFSFRHYHLLALDNRSERTLTQVMSPSHWQQISDYLAICNQGDLLILSAVPVVYRDFSFAEKALDATPWEEELTDDLKDHWRAKEHEGERLKLIMRLLDNAKQRQGKTVILSGDVHVGCLGVIRDTSSQIPLSIHQVVSSGIVHPAPSYIQWLGVLAVTNDDIEYLEETRSLVAEILKPHGSNKYIRVRNFVTLQEGNDKKLWINWLCESKDKPVYPLQ